VTVGERMPTRPITCLSPMGARVIEPRGPLVTEYRSA
jgi:hypothetical protein